MIISKDFVGGNIEVVDRKGNDVYLKNELRDTQGDWFYWAFCVENAAGESVTFHFGRDRLGYFGPAVSRDLKKWQWLGKCGENEFTYNFGKDENRVYFAHSMLYHPDRFYAFAAENGIKTREFCKSRKGRSVPCMKIGGGDISVILTARHHACESTGNYVLEGVLRELISDPLPNAKILALPFVDFDGVVDGDQGKSRFPHDHNRDYVEGEPSIYPTTAKIREYAKENGCDYGFDFHSPWHSGGENDLEYIVRNSFEKEDRFIEFGRLFEEEITEKSFKYYTKNDHPYMAGWNVKSANFGQYMSRREENEIAFSLETPYFGTEDNKVSQENLAELGRCFARALKKYIRKG